MKLKLIVSGLALAAAMGQSAMAETVRIAEHRQARIDAMNAVVPALQEATGVDIEVVEYPGPDREYITKLLTELSAGTGPDIFSLPSSGEIVDFASAGYLTDVTDMVKGSEAWSQMYDIAKDLSVNPDGNIYIMPVTLAMQQFYYRKDLLEEAGVSTEQPESWQDLLDRAIEAKEKTGKYSLLMPMGVTWGGGSYIESFRLLIAQSSTPELVNEDGTFNLTSDGVREVFEFYQSMVDNELLPVDPLLGPDPWVIPKYEMFPDGELLITTCGSWCYIFDWGSQSKTPIPDVENVVGTWQVPHVNGGDTHVLVGVNHPWMVSSAAVDRDAAVKVLEAMGGIATEVSYAQKSGNLPARKDAIDSPEFQELTPLVGLLDQLEDGVSVETAPGFSTVMEGIGRGTEAILLGNADAAGAQQILIDYVKNTLGDDMVK
ncbi:ABC transporter substrate-binding protein [Martelella mediterranea]|uniref:Maltose-binding periplasmic protein n=1 Tax=Martelella mediterranea DSM 17316 TaxID=1122214 RepID=A0A1U9Z9V4_9HYPH|nr:extracellular solute-binding protein [Martelella mediterranea]AQZ54478.1 Maltose-binding periplasmic protein [Martelella mediterranea DSM 17316]